MFYEIVINKLNQNDVYFLTKQMYCFFQSEHIFLHRTFSDLAIRNIFPSTPSPDFNQIIPFSRFKLEFLPNSKSPKNHRLLFQCDIR